MFFLGIYIYKDIAFEHAGFQALGTCHTGLLVIGGEHLDGAVLDVLAFQHCHRQGKAHTVVGTEGGAVGSDPFTVYICIDGVLEEIVGAVACLLGNHIHMALEDDAAAVFKSGGGGSGEDDVSGLVAPDFHAVVLAPLKQVFLHFAFVL